MSDISMGTFNSVFDDARSRQNLRTVQQLARGNVTVTTEQYRQIVEKVYWAAQQKIVARKLLGPQIVSYNDEGVQSIGYDVGTDLGDARLDMKFTESKDGVDLTRTNVPVPIIHKEFEIDRRDLASSSRNGSPLSTTNAVRAAYRVAKLENATLLNGFTRDGTDYEVKGFYQMAGNTYSTSKDFGTASNILPAFQGAIALAMADNVEPPFNFVTNPTQFSELAVAETSGGNNIMTQVKALLAHGDMMNDKAVTNGGMIISSPDMAAGTGMIVAAPGNSTFEYHLAMDLTTELEILEKTKNLWGRAWLAGRLVVPDPNEIVTMTAI